MLKGGPVMLRHCLSFGLKPLGGGALCVCVCFAKPAVKRQPGLHVILLTGGTFRPRFSRILPATTCGKEPPTPPNSHSRVE